VILDETDYFPSWINSILNELNNVDPLKALLALSSPHEHYSGHNLNLSAIILGKSLSCLMHKRVAFHLFLIINIIEKKYEWNKLKARVFIFVYVIPFYIDMLYNIYKKYDHLLKVYDLLYDMATKLLSAEDDSNYDSYIQKLKNELKNLNEVIKSSCVVNKIEQYYRSFQLINLQNYEIRFENTEIVTDLDYKTIMLALMENEDAILNFFDEIDILRSKSMDEWTLLLNIIPNLPTEELVRTPLLERIHKIKEIERIKWDINAADENEEETKDIDVEGQSIGEVTPPPDA